MDLLGPLPGFNFYIMMFEEGASELAIAAAAAGAILGGFSECAGLDSEIAIEERLVGGINDRVFRFPGRATYPSITLKRGIAFSEDLYLWHESFLKGEGKPRDGLIFLANEMRVPVKVWMFEGGLPKKWSGPALNAQSSALAVESLEIAHRKLSLQFSPGQVAGMITDALGF
jgi:phage tail-like protein